MYPVHFLHKCVHINDHHDDASTPGALFKTDLHTLARSHCSCVLSWCCPGHQQPWKGCKRICKSSRRRTCVSGSSEYQKRNRVTDATASLGSVFHRHEVAHAASRVRRRQNEVGRPGVHVQSVCKCSQHSRGRHEGTRSRRDRATGLARDARLQPGQRQLYNVLAMLVKYRAMKKARNALVGHGSEIWRLLCEEYEPRQGRRIQAMLSAILRVQLRSLVGEALRSF